MEPQWVLCGYRHTVLCGAVLQGNLLECLGVCWQGNKLPLTACSFTLKPDPAVYVTGLIELGRSKTAASLGLYGWPDATACVANMRTFVLWAWCDV